MRADSRLAVALDLLADWIGGKSESHRCSCVALDGTNARKKLRGNATTSLPARVFRLATPELIFDDRPHSVRVDYGMHPNLRCRSDSGVPVSSLDEALMFARVYMDRSERDQTREAGAESMAERFEANESNSIELS